MRLVLLEARRLGMASPTAEGEGAWRALGEQWGGMPALEAWLADRGIEREWARHLVRDDRDWQSFVEQRFRAFAFVMPDELSAALGPGTHPPDVVARMQAELREHQTRDRLATWLGERARDVRVRRLLGVGERVTAPFE